MTVIEELQKKLEEVIEYPITSYSFDPLPSKVTIKVITYSPPFRIHTVEFLRVATHYYINDTGGEKSRRGVDGDPDPGDYSELTDATVLDYPVDIKMLSEEGADWVDNRVGAANIALDIWTQVVFLEAAEVRVDGESFVIGDW